jgi:hypothetical protein
MVMKLPFLLRIALLTSALGSVGLSGVRAQDTDPAPAGGHHHHDSVLTADEKTELKNDRDQVFAANPDLKSESKDLWDQRAAMKDASADDKAAFHDKWHAFQDKLDAAMEKIDPKAAPLIAKVKAAHHPKPDADASSDNSQ